MFVSMDHQMVLCVESLWSRVFEKDAETETETEETFSSSLSCQTS